INLSRRRHRARGKHKRPAVWRYVNARREHIWKNLLWYAAANWNSKNRTLTAIAGSEVNRVAIGRNHELINLQIKSLRQLDIRSRRAVVSHNAPAIGFEACGCLR